MVAPPTASPGEPSAAGVTSGAAPVRTRSSLRAVWLGLLITVCAAATIGMVAFLGWRLGPVPLAVGLAGAILPVPVLIACFLWLDRYEPSPTWITAVCFLWGAGVATSGAILLNGWATDLFARWGKQDALVGVLVAPVVEESLKAAFPLLLFVFYRKAYTGIIDGVVYCGLSATGFAMVENILYLGGHGYADASQSGAAYGVLTAVLVFIGRVPLSGFAHPLFTSMTGLGLGFAARSPRKAVRVLAPLTGLATAMTLHASWNLMASLVTISGYFFLYGYIAVFVPIFFLTVGLVLWTRSREGRLAERVLPVYAAAGWFSPPEVVALGTLGRRLSARTWAKRVAGDAGHAAMKRYQRAATRLALLRDGLNRGLYGRPAELATATAEEGRLLAEIDQYRRVFTGRDPVTPRAWWSAGAYQIQFPDGVVRPVPEPPSPVVPVPFPLAGSGLGGPGYLVGGPS
ncbi:MAG TPA: PrsW family intramembrane metalloprotease [Micromonosporaceae bacterium]|jgi:RsiW-degrading membrane proteinase PrsW (M82 family)